MADNNIIITIAIVLAVTLLFTGGFTGNAGRDFAYTPPEPTDLIGERCNPDKTYGEYLPGGQPAIIGYNADCTTYVKEYCRQTARPFERKQRFGTGAGAQQYDLVCVDRIIDSTQPTTEVGSRPSYNPYN